jgi:hypothetical protein
VIITAVIIPLKTPIQIVLLPAAAQVPHRHHQEAALRQ